MHDPLAAESVITHSVVLDAFTVTFDFRLSSTGNGRADGIVFVMETGGATSFGSGYGGFGVLGLSGYAVELDIFDSSTCDGGNGNHAGVDTLAASLELFGREVIPRFA